MNITEAKLFELLGRLYAARELLAEQITQERSARLNGAFTEPPVPARTDT